MLGVGDNHATSDFHEILVGLTMDLGLPSCSKINIFRNHMFMLNHVKNYDKKLSELTKNYLIKNGCFFFLESSEKS